MIPPRWRPGSRRLWSIAGYGFALLVAVEDALRDEQWSLAVVEATLGIGILIAVLLLSGVRIPVPGLETVLRVTLWNIVLATVCAVGLFFVGPVLGETLGFSLPGLAGLWLVVLAARFATSRGAIHAVAVVSGLLFLVQAAIYTGMVVFITGNPEQRLRYAILLAVVVLAGSGLVAWLVAAKRRRWSAGGREPVAEAP